MSDIISAVVSLPKTETTQEATQVSETKLAELTKPAEATNQTSEAKEISQSDLTGLLGNETPAQAQPAPQLPPPGKGSRSLDDYRGLDWTKTNAALAKETGVSRERIRQIRKEIDEEKSAQPTEPAKAIADFSDITPQQAVVDYAAMSQMIFDSSTGVLCMTFGPEWQPQSPAERDAVTQALATYLKAKEVKDIPPGMMLTIVILAYSAQRLKAPTTSNKLKLAWTWIKTKLQRKRNPVLSIVQAQPAQTSQQP